MLEYDPVAVDPLEDLFEKIVDARGGEMILIHVNENERSGPSVKVCSMFRKEDSILSKILPPLIEKMINDKN